jgi:hypothetical protein
LEYSAWDRVKAKDSNAGEKIAAWGVTQAMKLKRKLGMGMKKKRKQQQQHVFNKKFINNIKEQIKHATDIKQASRMALQKARVAVKNVGGKRNVRVPRIIPIPTSGGVLPLLPAIFAGLSALGALTGGISSVYRSVKQGQEAQQKLKESERHNQTMEAIALGGKKTGSGLYLKKYKSGLGLYLSSMPKKKRTPQMSKNF